MTPAEVFAGLLRLGNTSLGTNVASGTINLGTNSGTTAQPLTISKTLNNASLTETVLKLSVTNTSSNTASLLMDLCAGAAGATSMFAVRVTGDAYFANGATTNRMIKFQPTTSAELTLSTNYASNIWGFYTGSGLTPGSGYQLLSFDSSGNVRFQNSGLGMTYFDMGLTITDARNIVLATTTGTKIGTSASQKLGFWNATPVVQQVLATGTSKTVDDVITALQTLGLFKQA